MADVWQELFHFESRDLLTDLYKRAHGRSLSATKAYAIVASLAQGRAYFRSARGADDLVRPLLLYYGVTGLARATTLFLMPERGEEALAPAHGVTTEDWQTTLGGGEASDRIKRLPDLSIGFSKGTFSDLMVATEGVQEADGILAPDGRANYTLTVNAQTEFSDTDRLTLRDLLSRIPDLAHTYARTFNEFSRCLETRVSYTAHTEVSMYSVLDSGRLGLPRQDMLRERLLLPP
jgi:hypothetical protein